jgi:site-specific DNA-methyltransferase (adenine-specific)
MKTFPDNHFSGIVTDPPYGLSFMGSGLNNTDDDVCGKYGSIKAPQRNGHPTVKPLALMRYLLTLIAPPQNALILDPFAGSGTTILAAKQLGINAIGIEKDSDYAEIARARLADKVEEPEAQLDLFANA